jgi:hypothetical protein
VAKETKKIMAYVDKLEQKLLMLEKKAKNPLPARQVLTKVKEKR